MMMISEKVKRAVKYTFLTGFSGCINQPYRPLQEAGVTVLDVSDKPKVLIQPLESVEAMEEKKKKPKPKASGVFFANMPMIE